MQARDHRAERVHGGAEVTSGPRGQAEEAGRGPAGEMIIRPGQLQRAAGMRNGAVDVAAALGNCGAKCRDRGREGPQLLVQALSHPRHPVGRRRVANCAITSVLA